MMEKLGNKTGNVFGEDLTVVLKRLAFTAEEGLVLLRVFIVKTPGVCVEGASGLPADPIYGLSS